MTRSSILARASRRAVRQYASDYELPAKTIGEILNSEARRERIRRTALRRFAEAYLTPSPEAP